MKRNKLIKISIDLKRSPSVFFSLPVFNAARWQDYRWGVRRGRVYLWVLNIGRWEINIGHRKITRRREII